MSSRRSRRRPRPPSGEDGGTDLDQQATKRSGETGHESLTAAADVPLSSRPASDPAPSLSRSPWKRRRRVSPTLSPPSPTPPPERASSASRSPSPPPGAAEASEGTPAVCKTPSPARSKCTASPSNWNDTYEGVLNSPDTAALAKQRATPRRVRGIRNLKLPFPAVATTMDDAPASTAACWRTDEPRTQSNEQRLALEFVLSGNSVFVTGGAGTGKTFWVLALEKEARARQRRVVLTATTGQAAALYPQGQTIHSFMGYSASVTRTELQTERSRRRKAREIAGIRNVARRLTELDILVIDEASMLDEEHFGLFDEIARMARGCDRPFGGVVLVLVGDFLQLPPVKRDTATGGAWRVRGSSAGRAEPRLLLQDEAFAQCVPYTVVFQDNQRQRDDPAFARYLNEVRLYGGEANVPAPFASRLYAQDSTRALPADQTVARGARVLCAVHDVANEYNSAYLSEVRALRGDAAATAPSTVTQAAADAVRYRVEMHRRLIPDRPVQPSTEYYEALNRTKQGKEYFGPLVFCDAMRGAVQNWWETRYDMAAPHQERRRRLMRAQAYRFVQLFTQGNSPGTALRPTPQESALRRRVFDRAPPLPRSLAVVQNAEHAVLERFNLRSRPPAPLVPGQPVRLTQNIDFVPGFFRGARGRFLGFLRQTTTYDTFYSLRSVVVKYLTTRTAKNPPPGSGKNRQTTFSARTLGPYMLKRLEAFARSDYTADGVGEPVVQLEGRSEPVVVLRTRVFLEALTVPNRTDAVEFFHDLNVQDYPRPYEQWRPAVTFFPVEAAGVAATIHSAQGETIAAPVHVDLRRVFECGHGYVALSRAPSLESMTFSHLQEAATAFRVHRFASVWYQVVANTLLTLRQRGHHQYGGTTANDERLKALNLVFPTAVVTEGARIACQIADAAKSGLVLDPRRAVPPHQMGAVGGGGAATTTVLLDTEGGSIRTPLSLLEVSHSHFDAFSEASSPRSALRTDFEGGAAADLPGTSSVAAASSTATGLMFASSTAAAATAAAAAAAPPRLSRVTAGANGLGTSFPPPTTPWLTTAVDDSASYATAWSHQGASQPGADGSSATACQFAAEHARAGGGAGDYDDNGDDDDDGDGEALPTEA